MHLNCISVLLLVVFVINNVESYSNLRPHVFDYRPLSLKEKCPKVKAIRNFDLAGMMGHWYVVQYYASSEEASEYACMRSIFSMEEDNVIMNFTYAFEDDPLREQLKGNLTWIIPKFNEPAHWVHKENIYEGIYNTYIIDTDYKAWGLIMHCAEKKKSSRYLSALLLSRKPVLGLNVINFLREKLPRYDIDISFMFPIQQDTCDAAVDGTQTPFMGEMLKNSNFQRKIHPLAPKH